MNSCTLSFEFFPPKTAEGLTKLSETCEALTRFQADFFSVTFGAGGSTQEGSLAALHTLQSQGQQVAPHISCIGTDRAAIREILNTYKARNIQRLVALRGDLPSGMGSNSGEFEFANELVEFIRSETPDWFQIYVAAYPEYHPQASSPQADLRHFVNKVRAGANAAITQYFFNVESYFHFVDAVHAQGIDIPIIPGIMPITNYTQLTRFSGVCGAEIPRWIRIKLEHYQHDLPSLRAFGHDVIISLCDKLLAAGVPGLHFYTLNQTTATLNICEQLFNK